MHKNVSRLIEAFGIVKMQIPDLKLLIVGKKDPRYFTELQNAVNKAKVAESVVFTGFVAEDELPLFYQNAALFVFPS